MLPVPDGSRLGNTCVTHCLVAVSYLVATVSDRLGGNPDIVSSQSSSGMSEAGMACAFGPCLKSARGGDSVHCQHLQARNADAANLPSFACPARAAAFWRKLTSRLLGRLGSFMELLGSLNPGGSRTCMCSSISCAFALDARRDGVGVGFGAVLPSPCRAPLKWSASNPDTVKPPCALRRLGGALGTLPTLLPQPLTRTGDDTVTLGRAPESGSWPSMSSAPSGV